MRTTLVRWGDSLAVRLPEEAAAAAGLREGATIELTVENDAIVLRGWPRDIRDLVGRIDGPPPDFEFGDASRGGEVW